MAPLFAEQLNAYQTGWRQAVSMAITAGIPCPAMTAALGYFDSYRCAVLPATLLQGQRDYFGAHTFERIDRPAGEKYHVNWTEEGKPIKAV